MHFRFSDDAGARLGGKLALYELFHLGDTLPVGDCSRPPTGTTLDRCPSHDDGNRFECGLCGGRFFEFLAAISERLEKG